MTTKGILKIKSKQGQVLKLHKLFCDDCKRFHPPEEQYLLKNNVWKSINQSKKPHSVLCINCAQRRLGRKLKKEDLITSTFNWGYFKKYKI